MDDAQRRLDELREDNDRFRRENDRLQREHERIMHQYHTQLEAMTDQLYPERQQQRQQLQQREGPARTVWRAVEWGDYNSLVGLLERGDDPNPVGQGGETALALAVRTGASYTIVSALLQHGANPNATVTSGESVLMHAVRHGASYSIVSSLLQHEADPNFVLNNNNGNGGGETALLCALQAGASYSIVSALLQRGANPNLGVLANGDSSLIHVVRTSASYSIVSTLLQAHANTNFLDSNGESALVHALRNGGSYTTVSSLLQHGANPGVTDAHGTPVLILAIQSSKYAIWSELLDRGADINARDGQGWTALMHACQVPVPPVREHLRGMHNELLEGLRRNILELQQQSAQLGGIALQSQRNLETQTMIVAGELTQVQALLRRPGIQVDASARDGRTALMIASEAGHHEHVAALLTAGANLLLRTREPQGPTTFLLAAAAGHTAVVRMLVEHNMHILLDVDNFGRNVFHSALLGGHLAVIEELLKIDMGTDAPDLGQLVRDTDQAGLSALPLAAKRGYVGLVQRLLPFATSTEICQAQVATRLGVASDVARTEIHLHLIVALVERYGWFSQAGDVAPTDQPIARRRV